MWRSGYWFIGVTTLAYDGDGSRVLQIQPDGGKTVYIGAVEIAITGAERVAKTYHATSRSGDILPTASCDSR